MRRHYRLLYPLWIAVCAVLFVALRHSSDPSRRHDRIQSDDAAVRAIAILRNTDGARFARYQAVHTAWASRGEGGKASRWVVLCDRVPHTAMREAIVVELDGRDAHLLTIRPPG